MFAGKRNSKFYFNERRRRCFKEHARKVLSYGAAVIVMAFDEKGQADYF